MILSKSLLRILIHGRSDEPPSTRARVIMRWGRIAVLIVTGLITLQSVLLVAGAWRNDLTIQHNMGVAQAEVLSAGRGAQRSSSSPRARHLPTRTRCIISL